MMPDPSSGAAKLSAKKMPSINIKIGISPCFLLSV